LDNTQTTVPPIHCQPWCEASDGHTSETELEDQRCYGIEHRIEMHLHERVKMVGNRDDSQEWTEWQVHDWLTVYATKAFARETVVTIGRGDMDVATLTPSEASHLAHQLLLAVSEIEGKV
jgi:hypothetical protein